jgi:hypothetical protein
MKKFQHVANDLNQDKKIIFTAQSCRNFHQRMLICRFVFQQDAIPINPFNLFGYFLYEMVDRNKVRNANNNILKRCDELWIFGNISDGVLSEIITFKKLNKPIRYFDISNLPEKIFEISYKEAAFEDTVKKYKKLLK